MAEVLASRFGAGAEAAFAGALEVVPEVRVAAHPDLAPGPRRVARGAARGAREPEEKQLRLLAADEVARVAVRGRGILFVVEGRGRGVPEPLEGAREGLAQLARLFVEGERVVADGHAEVKRERALRGFELLRVGANVVEPPRVGLAEPAAQRGVVEFVTGDVCVFEHSLHVRLGQDFVVVLDARACALQSPLRRVVGGDARAPALDVGERRGLARERVDDRAEL